MPCSLKYSPQALHTGSPALFLRHRVVVFVLRLVENREKTKELYTPAVGAVHAGPSVASGRGCRSRL